jgi:hypothetical protein
MKNSEHVSHMGELRNAYKFLVGKPEWKVSRWEFDIRYNIGAIHCGAILQEISNVLPVPMAELSEAHTFFDRSNIGISGSNPARGMDVCPRFSVLCCPV